MENLILLPERENALRIEKLRAAASVTLPENTRDEDAALLIADNATIYYLTGRVFSGWAYIPLDREARPFWFVRRPVGLKGEGVVGIRKPEDIPSGLAERGIKLLLTVGMELNITPYNDIIRLQKCFPGAATFNVSPAVSVARSVKTPMEISMMERSGIKQEAVYRKIPKLYTPGMTDIELDVAIENLSRLEGCLGQFRISGQSMEFFMGNVLTGNNADVPTPYDFALGGRGQDPSLPVGASGAAIMPETTVSVDVNGNYTGYMTDMTRVFTCGQIPEEARRAHDCSIAIHREFRRRALPGTPAADLYNMAFEMAKEAGFERNFMGHRQHASFCGHGVGIEINEMPVIAPRSRDILALNNAIALEPKFVFPGVGAVGIENTYIITAEGARCITNAPEELIPLH